jgi:hypothetical protein
MGRNSAPSLFGNSALNAGPASDTDCQCGDSDTIFAWLVSD